MGHVISGHVHSGKNHYTVVRFLYWQRIASWFSISVKLLEQYILDFLLEHKRIMSVGMRGNLLWDKDWEHRKTA